MIESRNVAERRGIAVKSVFIGIFLLGFSMAVVGLHIILPWWILYGLPIAVAMYHFDELPLQHHWNPRVRELYPHRQWKVERAVMQLLHRMPILSASRLTSNSKRLPPELWSMILDHAIDIPFYFDTACESKNFYQFIRAQSSSVQGWEYIQSEQDRKALRSVCKLWASLLSQRSMRWVTSGGDWESSGNGVIRADLAIDGVDFDLVCFEAVTGSIVASTSHTRSLTTLTMNGYRRNSTEVLHSFIERCQENQLDRIQSFTLEGGYVVVIPALCLQEINSSFPYLRYLHLEGDIAHGGAVFEQLNILYLNVQLANPEEWSVPSLRHLALGERYLGTGTFTVDSIPAVDKKRLKSLLLFHKDASIIKVDARFWYQLASLEFLGLRFQYLHLVGDRPIYHPLSHLFLIESSNRWNLSSRTVDITTLDVQKASKVFRALQLLKFVTLPPLKDAHKKPYPVEWQTLFRLHRLLGMTWLDENGQVINPLAVPAIGLRGGGRTMQ